MRSKVSDSLETQRSKQLSGLFDRYNGPAFSIRLWDGWQWNSAQNGHSACTFVVKSADALASVVASPNELSLGQAFIRNELEVEADLFSAFPVVEYLFNRPRNFRKRAAERILRGIRGAQRRLKAGVKHSQSRDHASIAHHYDLPVDFYRPWLGETLAYSCAYFRSAEDCLDQAQEQKLELICRKLRLKEHERFLDIGCGWGSLILHAAGRHRALAHGITLSREQAAVTENRIRAAGLDQRCTVEDCDYRNYAPVAGSFDKIASVGMFEHVGLSNLPKYFKTIHSLLKPGGTFLNHGIARSHASPARASSFIDRYVFPDGRLITLTQAIAAAEAAGFEARDVENLREHYELTLRKWVEALRQNRRKLLEIVPETTYRIWLLYMAGSAAAFRSGNIAVYQILLSRPDRGRSRMPLIREDWYVQGALEETSSSQLIANLTSER